MKYKRKKELEKLIEHIKGDYDDNYVVLSRYLQKIAYCLHFVSDQDFSRSELQQLSFTVYELGECFYQADQVRKQHRYEHFLEEFEQFPVPSKPPC